MPWVGQADIGIFHHTTQNDAPFRTHELFISAIFQLVVLDHG